eukprot:2241536-Rhodomonas_salina.1
MCGTDIGSGATRNQRRSSKRSYAPRLVPCPITLPGIAYACPITLPGIAYACPIALLDIAYARLIALPDIAYACPISLPYITCDYFVGMRCAVLT